jgi:uncharacterized protein (DUF2147 family)
MLKPLVAVALLLVCNASAASGLSGFWQHPKDPVWLDVNEALGTGIVVRNDDDPTSVGFAVLKEVVADPKQGQWSGQVYVPQLGDYKRVIVTLPDANTLKMKVKLGFISRSVEWTKVSSVPQP